LSNEVLKDKETRLIEMYIKDYITKTQFYETLERIRKEENKK
jgi:hypothetical protein